MKKKLFISSFGVLILLCVIIFSRYIDNTREMNLSGIGIEYSTTDSQYQREFEITFRGKYTEFKLQAASFEGEIYIDGLAGIEKDYSVTVSFLEPNTFGTPLFRDKWGAYHGTQVHSIFIPQTNDYAIICLYNRYSTENNQTVASYDFRNIRFICIGDIGRQQAFELLKSAYE